MSDQSITSYCIEYAATQMSKCEDCTKMIPHKSLRVAEIYRKNKKVKKNQAKHTWYHFKCFKMPRMLTVLPLDLFKGYPALEEKDKVRVQKVIKNGVGASWKDIIVKTKEEKEEADAAKEETTTATTTTKKKRKAEEDNEDIDMTADLTGTQDKKKVKKNQLNNNNNKKKSNEVATEKVDTAPAVVAAASNNKEKKQKGAKKLAKKEDKQKPTKAKEVKLAKDDQLELESIANEFKMLQE